MADKLMYIPNDDTMSLNNILYLSSFATYLHTILFCSTFIHLYSDILSTSVNVLYGYCHPCFSQKNFKINDITRPSPLPPNVYQVGLTGFMRIRTGINKPINIRWIRTGSPVILSA